jgi:hypothetical protein
VGGFNLPGKVGCESLSTALGDCSIIATLTNYYRSILDAAPNNLFNPSGMSLPFTRKIECLVRCLPPG